MPFLEYNQLYIILRPAQKYFIHTLTPPLPVTPDLAYSQSVWSQNTDFYRATSAMTWRFGGGGVDLKDHPNLVAFSGKQTVLRTYSNPDPNSRDVLFTYDILKTMRETKRCQRITGIYIYLKLFCLSDQQSLYKGVEMKYGQNNNQRLRTHEPTNAKPRQRLTQTPWKLKRRKKC